MSGSQVNHVSNYRVCKHLLCLVLIYEWLKTCSGRVLYNSVSPVFIRICEEYQNEFIRNVLKCVRNQMWVPNENNICFDYISFWDLKNIYFTVISYTVYVLVHTYAIFCYFPLKVNSGDYYFITFPKTYNFE